MGKLLQFYDGNNFLNIGISFLSFMGGKAFVNKESKEKTLKEMAMFQELILIKPLQIDHKFPVQTLIYINKHARTQSATLERLESFCDMEKRDNSHKQARPLRILKAITVLLQIWALSCQLTRKSQQFNQIRNE